MTTENITRIINEWDPIDLFACGCPEDEYKFEIEDIEKAMRSNLSQEELASEIFDIFTVYFGHDVFTKSIDECMEIAKSLLSL